ncbi:PLxRFG domain-containing protein [uncultured Roseobacter sp.]|uniref:PLxRFG domain-containing protein n=1 Tax=uncultured Roseobacter sp. TaxID=114847 RepID=UPI0026180952|nr:PLxRFG domain-containing protein [uncultured Roseobacter sp.]
MAGLSPTDFVDSALRDTDPQGRGALRPKQPLDIDRLAVETRVPANVLRAMEEAGIGDPEGNAKALSESATQGEDLGAALSRMVGGDAGQQIINRAYDIADEMYQAPPAEPETEAKSSSFVGDLGRTFGGSVVKGVGAVAEGTGRLAEAGVDLVNTGVVEGLNAAGALSEERYERLTDMIGRDTHMAVLGEVVGTRIREGGDWIQSGVSEESRAAIEASTPDGELLDPSTWTLGEDASLRGYALLTVDVLGSLVPVVAAGIATGGAGAAAVGGAQGAGGGAELARAAVDEMDRKDTLSQESSYYNELRQSGADHDEAVERTKDAAAQMAGLMAAPVAALGGFATSKILGRGVSALQQRTIAPRIAGTAALSGVEEGVQEVVEGIASRYGVNASIGTDLDLTEGTFGDFILGALAGGVAGAAGGALPAATNEEDERPDDPLLLEHTMFMGSDGTADPAGPRGGEDGAVPPGDSGRGRSDGAAPTEPQGPLGAAARVIPDLPPEAAENIEQDPLFPDYKPGDRVDLIDERGQRLPATFLRETEGGVMVRYMGEEFELTAAEFEEAARAAEPDENALGSKAMPRGKRQADPDQFPETLEETDQMLARLEEIKRTNGADRRIMARIKDLTDHRSALIEDMAFDIVEGVGDPERADTSPQAVAQDTPGASPVDPSGSTDQPGTAAQNPLSDDERPDSGEDTTFETRPEDAQDDTSPPQPEPQDDPQAGSQAVSTAPRPDQDTSDRGNPSQEPIRTRSGNPFASERSARGRLKKDGLNPDDYEFRPEGSGVVAVPKMANLDKTDTSPPARPREPATPMRPAEEREQPDLLGAKTVTEDEMARAERDKRAWGKMGGMLRGGYIADVDETIDGFRIIGAGTRDNTGRLTIYRDGDLTNAVADISGDYPANQIMRKVRKALRDAQSNSDQAPEAQPAPAAPSAEEVTAAAAEADPNPTDAQKEAENYKMGHIQWNGLDMSIENAKGSIRSGKGPDGSEWSVTMPAHYGRIKGTIGADGDHVDIYMGDDPDSDYVLVVNQIDADTSAFDEHKVMLGFGDKAEALDTYRAGFSDGRADDRLGSYTETTVADFKAWLESGDTKKPTAPTKRRTKAKAKPAPKPTYGASNTLVTQDRAAELRAKLAEKLKGQINAGIDPEILAMGAELMVFHIEAGARKFTEALGAVAEDLGTTPDKLTRFARSWYNGARDLMEDSDLSIEGMDDAEAVREALNAIKAGTTSTKEPESGTISPAQSEDVSDENRTDAGDDRAEPSEGPGTAEPESRRTREVRGSSDQESGSGDTAPEGAEQRPEPSPDGAGDSDAGRAGGSDSLTQPTNHVILPGGLAVKGGEKTRARNSVAAIRVLKTLQRENRPATAEERQTLSLYGGAGTLAAALPNSEGRVRFADIAADLNELLSDEEKATLSRTSQYAFYTAEPVLRNLWAAAQHFGFRGGRVYEPGMGVGGFAGTIPGDIRGSTKYQGLELDLVTAGIAKALYPQSRIDQGDFTKVRLPQDYYDLVIGNPPFSGTKIQSDPDYPQNFMIHDYFFAKSLDAVRPGGLLMFVTSAGTMNKRDSAARDYLADRAELVGAIRLPNTAFEENGTKVTTDIVMLRKRNPGETETDRSWRTADSVVLQDKDGNEGNANLNLYFAQNPNMVLGEQGLFDTLVPGRARIGVVPKPDSDLRADLQAAIASLPSNVMTEATQAQKLEAVDGEADETKAGGYYLKGDDLYQFDGNTGRKVEPRSRENTKGMPKAAMERVKAILPIKTALRDVYAIDADGGDAKAARKALNKAYDAFVGTYGPINKAEISYRKPSRVELEGMRQSLREEARRRGEAFNEGSFDPSDMIESGASLSAIAAARSDIAGDPSYDDGDFDPASVPDKIVVKRPNIDPFADDQESYRLRAIEHYDDVTGQAKKGRVFRESVISRANTPKIDSPEDALLYVLGDTGRVDLDRIAELSGSDVEAVTRELTGKIFRNPDGAQWETAAKYLSGPVRKKLEIAEEAAKTDPQYKPNVRALQDVQPEQIPASEIIVPIGAHWFDPSVYGDFAKSLGLNLNAKYQRALGVWTGEGTMSGGNATSEHGTEDYPFGKLMLAVMNNKTIKVTRTIKDADGSTKTYTDETATQAAVDKANEVQAAFSDWFWSDDTRSDAMVDLYNATFNGDVAPNYDGGYLTTPGIDSNWKWRPHQSSVVARILQSGNTYMAHTVGAGKTSAMIGAAMEARRLGLAKKPMIVVPNHMLAQFSIEFYEQYPLANIAIADEKRFHTSRRKQFIADIALNDYDAVIITHSAFGKIAPSEASKARAVEGMLNDIREVVDSNDGGADRGEEMAIDRSILGALGSIASVMGVDANKISGEKGVSTRKKIEQMLEAAEQRMSRQLNEKSKDAVFDFDEIGTDMLFVDEAHLFRKLSFATTNGNIKGIDPMGSQASMDLFIKARSINHRTPGRGLIFASGTPITNTMAELFSLSRYLQPEALEERGVAAFDAWAQTFGVTSAELEQNPDGTYKQVARFSKFVNVPELSLMVRQVMDVVSSPDLEQYVTRPKLKGGERNLNVVEPSDEVKRYQQVLAARMRIIANRTKPPQKGDDIILSVINDGRLSAIDMRLVDPTATGHGSKLERMISNTVRTYKKGANTGFHGVKPEGGYTDKPIMRGPSTQMIFSTLGLNGSKHNADFRIHEFIRSELIARGVKPADIVLYSDLKTHVQRQRAFNDLNDGKKRILIGSERIFTGVNAQKRLAALHNLDPLWYPAADEQRNGRGLRQGNMNPEIEINDYSTKGTYDATMWQMMGRKAGFIEGFFRGDPTMREIEDLGEASAYEQAKAMSTSDPRVLKITELKGERDKLTRRRDAVDRKRVNLRRKERIAQSTIESLRADLPKWEALAGKVENTRGDAFRATIAGAEFVDRKDAGNALFDAAAELAGSGERRKTLGQISGFKIRADYSKAAEKISVSLRANDEVGFDVGFTEDPVGLVRRLEGALAKIKGEPVLIRADLDRTEKALADVRQTAAGVKDFADDGWLAELNEQIDTIESEMLSEAEEAAAQEDTDQALEGWDMVDPFPEISREDMRQLRADVQAEMDAVGLTGKVSARVLRQVMSNVTGQPVQGAYRRTEGAIRVAADSGAGPMGTLNHEIIHALRDSTLWQRPYGLFTQKEWRALARKARADKALIDRLKPLYPDLSYAALTEEAVAETYRAWRSGNAEAGPFQKVRQFLEALANALRGNGFVSAGGVMQRIADGEVGGRSPDMRSGATGTDLELRNNLENLPTAVKNWRKPDSAFLSDLMSDAMGGRPGLLSLVPGRPLFEELGKDLPSAQSYLKSKERMDALRNDMQANTAEVVDRWLKANAKHGQANVDMMKLMHDATLLGGVNPMYEQMPDPKNANRTVKPDPDLRKRWLALPEDLQKVWRDVSNTYDKLGDDFEKALLDQVKLAGEIGLKRAKTQHKTTLRRINDEGLKGQERADAIAEADAKLAAAQKRAGWAGKARMAAMRKMFESNRLDGPYFPLARFGQYFVTVRNAEGKVISFSKFERRKDQRAFVAQQSKNKNQQVTFGVMSDSAALKEQVDPGFVADIEELLGDSGTPVEVMDAVWQRWLETLPDQSIRTSRIHRKGRAGYSGDAIRAFSHHNFHGAHQLARLKFGMRMQDALDDARIEVEKHSDPVRAGMVVNEMGKRHEFTMQPTGGRFATAATSLAFVWYLGVTPAAALVNLSQTTVVGIPILGAAYTKYGASGAARFLMKAMKDFAAGVRQGKDGERGLLGANLKASERRALEEAYKRGTVDKTQAHELASVAESGVEYSGVREKWMRRISFFFHHAERMNREVTFLAAYRMGRSSGLAESDAVDAAVSATWKTHFDYQNTARPRIMQNDTAKVLLVFRSFTINMLWRLFRDSHQALKSANPDERKEARAQLTGITLSMMAHAGITGTWGYGLITGLLALLPGGWEDDEEVDQWLQDSLLLESDSLGASAWNYAAGMALKGVPGHMTKTSLNERIGMPDLWFRGSDRPLEGQDLFNHWVGELLGPVAGIAANMVRGVDYVSKGEYWRGFEASVPKAIRDVSRGIRYTKDGVTTINGDPILEDVNARQAITQALGFTPAEISERYKANTRMKNREKRIGDRRRGIVKDAALLLRDGKPISADVIAAIREFNREYPTWPIDADTIRRSVRGRMRASQRNEFGVQINPRLNDRIRSEDGATLYIN